MASPCAIPTISLGDARNRQEIVKEIREACLLHGFFQIVDHGVPQELINGIFETTRRFFELSNEIKTSVLKVDHTVGGYEPFRLYNLKSDQKRANFGVNEGFAIAPAWGKNRFLDDITLPGFSQACTEYFTAVQELGKRALALIAEGLQLNVDFFEPYLDEQMSFARLTHYYRAASKEDNEDEEPVGAAEHTDWGSLTLLVQDGVGGLQVFDHNGGVWVDVPPVSGAFVCNIGDLLSRWTNDTYRSTLHRVLAPPPGVHRYSIPFFNPGKPSHLVKVIRSCIPEGEEPKYAPITAGDYIKFKHYSTASDPKST